ncbi:hypothetical protein GJV06_08530 [Enterobacteriaceae bacterium RIT691]|nr:hypothetical protein [Enterobacteriaceae bacterium RIT691]
MKKIILVLLISSSFSAIANDVSQAQEAVAHAERNYSAAVGRYKSEAHYSGSGVNGSAAETNLNNAAAARSQAYSDLRSAEEDQQSKSISNYGVKTNSAGNPVTMVAGTKNSPTGNSTINVAASTLSSTTRVKTDKGIVTAGSLPKNTQVAVAFNSPFSSPVRGGNEHSTSHSHGEHGTGNGENNAANSHSAHGLGGSESIGGGHSGGGFHY